MGKWGLQGFVVAALPWPGLVLLRSALVAMAAWLHLSLGLFPGFPFAEQIP